MQIIILKIILSFVTIILFLSCKQQEFKHLPHLQIISKIAPASINYDSCKKIISVTKQNNKRHWNILAKFEKEKIFTAAVTYTIIPNWLGTTWDFNGVSEKPQQGAIACGYFVTTVLRDAGLPVARIKLAQCASEQMITTLVQPTYVQRFSNVTTGVFVKYIESLGYGLYIVGLDNHTGFIYNDGTEVYFIHSSIAGSRNVQQEKALTSLVLMQSKYKVLGKISADEKVLSKWIY